MTSNTGPPTSTDWWREVVELRAEIEGVKRGLFKMPVTYGGADSVLEMVDRAQDELARRTNSLNELRAENERLRAALAEVLTIDHSKRGCCEWHVLNGKPWIPAPTGVIHVVSDKE